MKASILSHSILEKIPSASGIEFYEGHFYIIGDNCSWLFVLNTDFEIVGVKEIFDPPKLKNEVIPKKKKPDLEALTMITVGNENKLLVFGSGSKSPERDKAYLINPINLQEKAEEYVLTLLYDQLRNEALVAQGFKLNIEGAAATGEKLFLFQRGNISGNNAMIVYELEEFTDFIFEKANSFPIPTINNFDLPVHDGLLAGFSGAAYLEEGNKILFTATVEDTKNEIDDGVTLGSFVGLIDLNDINPQPICAIVMLGDEIFKGKIESIAPVLVYENYIKAVAVTDNDGEASEIIEIEIQL